MEMPSDRPRCSVRLSSAHADGVISASDDRVAVLCHHAQVPVLQLEMDLLTSTGIKVNALKSA